MTVGNLYKNKIEREDLKELPLYSFDGEVVVVDDLKKVDEAVADLRCRHCLGFDTETRPAFQKGVSYRVGLLQLATDNRVYLFRLNKTGLTPSLRQVLADTRIIKVGVGIRDDIKALRKMGEFLPAAFADLQVLAIDYGIEEKSFSKLMAIIFNVRISKRQRVSNWEAPVLLESQVRYAATDAWGALKMYEKLKKS